MTEKITHVAIKLATGCIIMYAAPHRHSAIMLEVKKPGFFSGSTQGFVTSRGRFLTREEAWPVAKAAGQLLPAEGRDSIEGVLYSEDIW